MVESIPESELQDLEGFRLSPQQARLWEVMRADPEWPRRIQGVFALDSGLEKESLLHALDEVVSENEILRTVFRTLPGMVAPFQVITESSRFRFEEIDLAALEGEELAAEEQALFDREFAEPLAPEKDLPLSVKLLRCGEAGDRLLLSLPSLASDARGLEFLAQRILQATANGGLDDADEVVQYADVAEIFQQLLESEDTDLGREFWARKEFADPCGGVLPGALEEGAGEAPTVGEVSFTLPEATSQWLLQRAESEEWLVEDALAGAWAALLYRLGGPSPLTLGWVFDGRGFEGLEMALGLFERTLPVPLELGEERPLESLIHGLHTLREEFGEQQEYFAWQGLEEAGGAQEDQLAILPFGFAWYGEGEGLEARRLRGHSEAFHLRLSVQHSGSSLLCTLAFDTRRYASDQVAKFGERFCTLLESWQGKAAAVLGELEIVSSEERRFFEQVNSTQRGFGEFLPAQALFAAQAASTPEERALEWGDGEGMTYRELEQRANRLARALRGRGVGVEEVVGLQIPRSPEMVVALLGILKAGGAYLPLEQDHPPERRLQLLRDAGARLLLTWGTYGLAEAGEEVEVLDLEAEAETLEELDDSPLPEEDSPRGLAYVLYTSGSTGQPKGVMIPHEGLSNYLRWCVEEYALGVGGAVPMHSPLGFDFTLTSLLAPLTVGATVVLLDEEKGIESLTRTLTSGREWGLLKLTPAHLQALGQWLRGSSNTIRLRSLVVGGEALTGEHLALFQDIAPRTRVFNEYGPTEAVVGCTVRAFTAADALPGAVPIGRPIANATVHLTTSRLAKVPPGRTGSLFIGGHGLARGYLGRPALTAEKFRPDPFAEEPGQRLYDSGDRARWRDDGNLEYLGRSDDQIKLRGVRIEPAEVEAVLTRHPAVEAAVVMVKELAADDQRLVAYVCFEPGKEEGLEALREALAEQLPDAMVPSLFLPVEKFSWTRNGKIDRSALPSPKPPQRRSEAVHRAPNTRIEQEIQSIWQEVLQVSEVGLEDNFFELGGHSLLLARVRRLLKERLGREISMVDMFRFPTVLALAGYLDDGETDPGRAPAVVTRRGGDGGDIAIVGLSGRFPGAENVQALWDLLREGREGITHFSEEELLAADVPPQLLEHPHYVRAKGVLEKADLFDAGFFGFSPREAQILDPQHRVFLECAWHALENAGYDPFRYPGRIGLFAGTSASNYWRLLASNPEMASLVGGFQVLLANDKDYLPTRVSYKLNLTGPSINVQTACSTSLVAVHLACRCLQQGEAEMVLAGGVSVGVPSITGYLYEEGGVVSPDGHCRAFDRKAQGTLSGDGVGVVVLKRLVDAQADGDTIHAVIKGSAVNNDGAQKVGYASMGLDGPKTVIRSALEDAGVEAGTLSLIEAHGTGTPLGDPIEARALREVFATVEEQPAPCALGSVKTNLGHLDAAAGVTGLIKAVLSLRHRQIPPSLHFEELNPEINFDGTPLAVQTTLADWPEGPTPRRAGVSSLGIGGTNAHVVVEEAPAPGASSEPSRPHQLLVLSARSESTLEILTEDLAKFLEHNPEVQLADLAFTLQVGRRLCGHRRVVIAEPEIDLPVALRELDPQKVLTSGLPPSRKPSVVFLFPGQGSQYLEMGRELYCQEAFFREAFDQCAELLQDPLGKDLRRLLYPEAGVEEKEDLDQTWLTQPALFAVEYSLARLFMAWGVMPTAMVGHSIGEYVAACLAGVFTLADALALVAERARLMQSLPVGSMLAVALPEDELEEHLGSGLSLAVVNGPGRSVVAGEVALVEELRQRLEKDGVTCRLLQTSHAFHSPMVEDILEPFRQRVAKTERHAPELPFLSNTTGTWIRDAEAMDPEYWVRHLRGTVRFADNLEELLQESDRILLELGPGDVLSHLARRHSRWDSARAVIPTLGSPKRRNTEASALARALGQLWLAGVEIAWESVHGDESRRRIPVTPYPFERQRYWISPSSGSTAHRPQAGARSDLSEWFYIPSWKRSPLPRASVTSESEPSTWLLFCDEEGVGEHLGERLEGAGRGVVRVEVGDTFARHSEGCYSIDPGEAEHYETLLEDLVSRDRPPTYIVHLWSVTSRYRSTEATERLGFFSLLLLARSLGGLSLGGTLRLAVVSKDMQPVTGVEQGDPALALLVGPCRTIPREFPDTLCQSIDLDLGTSEPGRLADFLVAELNGPAEDLFIAYRGGHRWVESFEPVALDAADDDDPAPLRRGGVYVVTGGLGGMGLELAKRLARDVNARLVLMGRTPLPEREEWDSWLSEHGKDDGTSRRIVGVRELEAAGGEVLLQAADVADLEQVRSVLEAARQRFGGVHGIVHAAGLPPGGLIQLGGVDSVAGVLAPKVAGLRVLEEVFAEEDLDFLLLCSSLSAQLSQLGRIDYCAANAFLDAFAHRRFDGGAGRVVSINWDTWRDAGMAHEESRRRGHDPQEMIPVGMSSEQGWQVFLRTLRSGLPQVVVSIEDLDVVRERSHLAATTEATAAPEAESRRAAAHPRPALANPFVPPESEAEEIIAAIWADLLGLEEVGIHDNFFELGGDSILTIQIIARLNQTGLHLTPTQVFDHQTVAELAAVAGTGPRVVAEQEVVAGDLPLTPIQRWFLEQEQARPQYFNQATLLSLRKPLDSVLLHHAMAYLLWHHDSLRLRFYEEKGEWRQHCSPPEDEVPSYRVDLSALPEERRSAVMEKLAADLQASLDLSIGPIARLVTFDFGPESPGRLLMIVHHLAVDAVSWRILLEDLATAYQRLEVGERPELPPKTTSFHHWSHRLADYASEPALLQELGYWRQVGREATPLPVDFPEGDPTVASLQTVQVTLDSERTRVLLQEVPKAYRVQINDVLLSALVLGYRNWGGGDQLLVELEGHGREPIFGEVDLSRTVGWFTTLFPVFLRADGLSGDPETVLKTTKEELRLLPGSGLGYGVLRHLAAEEPQRILAELPRPEVSFLYLGQLDQGTASGDSPFGPAPESSGPMRDPQGHPAHRLEIISKVAGGCLRMTWMYSENLFHRDSIEGLAENYLAALETLITLCTATEDAGYTPSDFPQADLDQGELDDLLSELAEPLG